MSEGLAITAVMLTPWAAALFAAVSSRFGLAATSLARGAAAAVGVGFGATVVVGVSAIVTGATPGMAVGASSLRLDALGLILSLLVLGLSALIQTFAIRYLRGDPRQAWFVIAANLLTGSTVLLVCAGSVAIFAAGWIGAGGSLLMLLATYSPLAQARDGVRRTGSRFLLGDAAFLIAIGALLATAGGDVSFDRLGGSTGSLSPALQLLIAVLLVIAALARSTQVPFHGWLPFTLATPTPVSALMHAGVVNAGAVLLVRFAPVIARHELVMVAIFVAGALTLVYASAMRLTRADVKGALVFSTMAQMGFMIMTCGLGLFAAAIFHLVAHSLFKSALFLGAGSGVSQRATARDLPARADATAITVGRALAVAVPVTAASLVSAELLISPTAAASSVGLLVFVALSAGVALTTALITDFSPRAIVAGSAALVALAFGYVAFLHVFSVALQPDTAVQGAPAWLLAIPAVGLLAVQLLARNPRALARVGDRIYATSLTIGITKPNLRKGVTS